MEFIKNKKYIIRTNTDGHLMTYHCEVILDDINSVKIVEKYGKILYINKQFITTAEELKDE